MVAARRPVQDHPLTLAQGGDALAQLLDHTRALVSQNQRERPAQLALDEVPVAVAQPRGLQPDANFALARRQELDIFDGEWSTNLVQDC